LTLDDKKEDKKPVSATHEYSKTLADLRDEFFRVIKDSNSGSWDNNGTSRDIKVSKGVVEGNPFGGYLKGEGTISGVSPHEFLTTFCTLGCKKICEGTPQFSPFRPAANLSASFYFLGDQFIDTAKLVESFSPGEYLEISIARAQMGVSYISWIFLVVSWLLIYLPLQGPRCCQCDLIGYS